MTELTTVQAAGHHTAKLNGTWLYRAPAVPGDYNLVLLDQLLANKSMEQIGCRNELNASYAAEAYAQVNGCGAVLATMNVGVFSALNGVAGAYAERLQVILVASGYNTNDASTDHLLHQSPGTLRFRAAWCIEGALAASA
jgi:pyruvate decarboxylase